MTIEFDPEEEKKRLRLQMARASTLKEKDQLAGQLLKLSLRKRPRKITADQISEEMRLAAEQAGKQFVYGIDD